MKSDPAAGSAGHAGRFRSAADAAIVQSHALDGFIASQWDFQGQMFQPVGGMGMIGKAFGRLLGGMITYNARSRHPAGRQGRHRHLYRRKKGGAPKTANADWCVCTIPASVLGQIPMNVGAPMQERHQLASYIIVRQGGPAVQAPLLGSRMTPSMAATPIPTSRSQYRLSLPRLSSAMARRCCWAPMFIGTGCRRSINFAALPPARADPGAVEQGAKIHPQYKKEFQIGVAVAWHRVPWSLGCPAVGLTRTAPRITKPSAQVDNRIVLAGEHCSHLMAWQEGAVLSALDAISRLHKRVMAA